MSNDDELNQARHKFFEAVSLMNDVLAFLKSETKDNFEIALATAAMTYVALCQIAKQSGITAEAIAELDDFAEKVVVARVVYKETKTNGETH